MSDTSKKKNNYAPPTYRSTSMRRSSVPDVDIIDLDAEKSDEIGSQDWMFQEEAPILDSDEETEFPEVNEDFPSEDALEDEVPDGTDPDDMDPDDMDPDDMNPDDTDSNDFPLASRKTRRILHIILILLVIAVLSGLAYRLLHMGRLVDPNELPAGDGRDIQDSILPLFNEDKMDITDDGVTTIVAFGNAPFADDKGSPDSLANLISTQTGAVVYDCSVPGSYLAALGTTLDPDLYPMDAFNFYWLATAFCLRNNDHIYQDYFSSAAGNLPQGGKESYDLLQSIDFSKVDVITLMYDGSDYLEGHPMYSDDNETDIQQFTGNMAAGIQLIQATYPHIRIIVMSPTYAFAVDENGKYVSSDIQTYGQDVLSTYVIKQAYTSFTCSVTFVDNLYGTITEDNAKAYLSDNLHLNQKGRELVASRFIYALTYYDDKPAVTTE